jgi:cytochrome c553
MWVFSFYFLLACALVALSGLGLVGLAPRTQAQTTPVGNCPSWPLPLPSKIGANAFEALLGQYVNNNCYQTDKNWRRDASYRDTGFLIGGKNLGTHKAVRVYYSPEMYSWMQKGEPEGKIPEGAAIIKEMYPMPASQSYTNADRSGWAIMVRDTKVAWDGWFWSDGGKTISYQFNYPSSGYALYCMNCHASTAKTDLTFSAMRNITGDPIVFNATVPPNKITLAPTFKGGAGNQRTQQEQESVQEQQIKQKSRPGVHEKRDSRPDANEPPPNSLPKSKSSAGGAAAESVALAPAAIPKQFVMEYFDTVTQGPRPKVRDSFLTSNQCIGCHDATQNNDSQPNMIYPQIYSTPPSTKTTEIDLNLSPYGEWRASMMGLSGRDPIFFSQLETELNLHPEQKDNIVGTCLSCHGVMGQRQIEQDKRGPFKLEYLDEVASGNPLSDASERYAKYGALARDGVSCTVCHRISAEGLGTPATYTGKFKLGKPDEIFGPYEDVVKLPMENSLGLTPRKTKENQIRSSALCGSCHTVVLPVLNIGEKYSGNVFDNPKIKTEHEQNTYLEWRNSKYQNEQQPFNPADVQTCQDCHMPNKYPSKTGDPLRFKIASIEEDIFAATDNRAADKDIHLQVRGGTDAQEPYSRHTLVGMNIFALEIFNQFSSTLGLVSYDPMASFWGNSPPGLVLVQKSALDLARKETATVEVLSVNKNAQKLTAQVKVTNLAGHKFPSGVSFRRAFIEFRVDVGGVTRWASGATDNMGMIGYQAGTEFAPLLTESFNLRKNPQQIYQPHYEVIDDQKKVQIYEELIKDSNGNFTTSFLSLANDVKDNRLMPQGWKCIEQADGKNDGEPCGGTAPHGVPNDPRTHPNSAGYFNGTGSDIVTYEVPLRDLRLRPGQQITVTATIYYQTIPPYYLEQRRDHAPNGVFTKSLMYYVNNLDVTTPNKDWKLLIPEPPIKNWKLMIASNSKSIK